MCTSEARHPGRRTSDRHPVPRPPTRTRLFVHELNGLLVLAGPLVINQLGQVGMHTADTIMVGPLGAELGINIVANWLLIYDVDGWIPGLGVVGAGWATTLVRWSMLHAHVRTVPRAAATA